MIRRVLSAALVSAAIVVAGPALAGPGGGGGGHGGGAGAAGAHGGMGGGAGGLGGGAGGGMGGIFDRGGRGGGMSGAGTNIDINGEATRINNHATTRASSSASFNRTTTTTSTNPAIGVSQGPLHASPTGIAHANSHSVLAGQTAGQTVVSGSLAGLTTGMTVQSSTGTTLGTVSRIVTDRNGNVRTVLVTSSTGRTFRLSPTMLSLSGGIVTTTMATAMTTTTASSMLRTTQFGRVSSNSSLGKRMVVSGNLTGLTTGLTVQSSTGTELGTISRIVTDKNGNIRTVFVTSSTGQVVRLSPAMISLSGGIVTLATATLPTRGAPTTNPAIGVSQGPLHASATGIAHANSHSVLAAGAVAGTTLPGLTTGLTVTNANGTNIGTISQIVTDTSGNIRLVIVTNSTTGLNFRLAPTTLTISGNMVETTSTVGG